MSDCPYCDWHYDSTAAPMAAFPAGQRVLPFVFDGTLRVARGSEPPSGRPMATGWHICTQHTFEPDVLLVGPWEERLFGSVRAFAEMAYIADETDWSWNR